MDDPYNIAPSEPPRHFEELRHGAPVAGGAGGAQTDLFAGAIEGDTGASAGLTVSLSIDNLSMFLRALEEVTDTTIMANPKIIALNKQAGKIIIGDENGYASISNVAEGGTATQQVEFLESGTVLEFRPFICKDGMIRMELHPEQSSQTLSEATNLPNKSTTEVLTNIMVKDGKTIVIGGLFKERTLLSHNQVPILGDIPVVGEFFRGVGDTSERVELIVLITPHIIDDPEQAEGAERLQDALRLTHNARNNLFWMSRARIDEDRYARAVKYYMDGDYASALAEINNDFSIERNYLEKIRLKERILRETQPEQYDQLERIMLRKIEKEESGKWFRW